MSRALVFFALLAFVGIASASHLRYGAISFKKTPGDPLLVTFTFTGAVRYSAFYTPVGGQYSVETVTFGDGSSSEYPPFTVNNADIPGDSMFGTSVFTHRFPRAGTYTVTGQVCCRVSYLNNLHDDNFAHSATITITAAEIAGTAPINNSPTVNSLPVIFIPYGVANYQYALTALDDEGDALTYSMSTLQEMTGSSGSAGLVPGLSISPSGLITLSTTLGLGFWTTQQTISDGKGNKIAVDYLLNVQPIQSFCNNPCATPCSTSSSCNSGPCGSSASTCVQANPRIVTASLTDVTASARTNLPSPADGSALTFAVGNVYYINFVADDSNLVNSPNTPVAIAAAGLPAGVTAETQTACDAAHNCQYVGTYATPQLRRFRFAPTQVGQTSVLCIGAVSGGVGLSYSQHCVTLAVPNSVCGNSIVESGEDCDGGDCCTATCNFASTATTCRSSAGDCDVAETCSGSSSSCPADSFSSGSVCRAAAGDCDVAEVCSGSSASCPADSFASGSVCRAAAGPCDQDEVCSGSSAICPSDAFKSGDVCRAAVDTCDVAETCSGSSAACPANLLSQSANCFCARQADPNADPNIPVSTYYCNQAQTGFYQCMSGLWAALSANQPCAAGTLCQCPQGVDCSCAGNPCTIPGDVPSC